MSQILKQKFIPKVAKVLKPKVRPVSIAWPGDGKLASIAFSNGKEVSGSCIRCLNPPCMEFAPEELIISKFKDFPSDQNTSVCPTSAITWPQQSESPVIDNNLCIACGLCVSRCPMRAIGLNDEGAFINDTPNQYFIISKLQSEDTYRNTLSLFKSIQETGSYLIENDHKIALVGKKVEEVAKTQPSQFPNLLVRNLLIAVGLRAAMRRRGDNNIRMDMVLELPHKAAGVAEIELGMGVLDAPRNILDDIAVLASRYDYKAETLIPLITGLHLPNLRSEYWQLIKDIKETLGIKINTITVGALILLVWNRKKIDLRQGNELYIDIENSSLKGKLQVLLGRDLKTSTQGCVGILISEK